MATNYSQISYGSKGDDVKTLQQMLNQNGYSLEEDGIFGSKTQTAVKDYQTKNGLQVDGIVGKNTWGALNGTTTSNTTPSNSDAGSAKTTSPSTETSAPTSAADMNFTYDPYQKSDAVTQAEALLQQQLAGKPGEYNSPYADQIQEIMDKILNREEFSYDLNGDALYQQYKDQYTTQGKMAMMDTMGQAAAMTGGYGNSYAQTAGQQTYQGYLQQLNEVIPELYQMALDKYNQEGEGMYNQYGLLVAQDEQAYGRYRDTVSDYNTELARLTEDARYKGEQDYSRWADGVDRDYAIHSEDRSYKYQSERDAVADQQWQADLDEGIRQFNASLAEDQRQYDSSLAEEQRQYDQNFAYQTSRDSVEDQQWQADFDEGIRQFNASLAEEQRQFNSSLTAQQNNNVTDDTGDSLEDEGDDVFSGTTYSEAVDYMESNGVPSNYAAGILAEREWQELKAAGSPRYGANEFDTYAEYLEYAVYANVQAYGNG